MTRCLLVALSLFTLTAIARAEGDTPEPGSFRRTNLVGWHAKYAHGGLGAIPLKINKQDIFDYNVMRAHYGMDLERVDELSDDQRNAVVHRQQFERKWQGAPPHLVPVYQPPAAKKAPVVKRILGNR